MLGKVLANAGIVVGEAILTAAANYATSTVIDMYAHPDLKDCKTDEERQQKIQKFQKTMNVVKPIVNVIEAGIIGAGACIACDAINNVGAVTSEESGEYNTENAALIGASYLI